MSNLKEGIELYNIAVVNSHYNKAIGRSSESNRHRRLKLVIWICGLYALKAEDVKLVLDANAQKLYLNFSSKVKEIPILNLNTSKSNLSGRNTVG